MRVGRALICALCLVLGFTGFTLCSNRTDDPIGVAVSPQTLVLDWDQGCVCVHTDIPLSQVCRESIILSAGTSSIEPISVGADSRGSVVAQFEEAAVEAIVSPPETVLTLSGQMLDGSTFSGSDSVRVITKS